jgi:hypothetical protein
VVSADDSDVCNLGSINLGRIESVKEFSDIVELATKFSDLRHAYGLTCLTLRSTRLGKRIVALVLASWVYTSG